MSSTGEAGCRFCQGNDLLTDAPLGGNRAFYMLGSIDPEMPHAVMIILRRHAEDPFDIWPEEWAELGEMLLKAKAHLASCNPDGFTLGWNVGAVAGQHVFHVHLHVVARFAGERNAGKGIRAVIRS
ncbi:MULTISPECIES: HIT domain-containing protein [unclassified Rhizobium]|jgi:diadenosine tetraphosphate (Ap4A) HIT family hydrolase|uniref:HIT family protein n=1 Tax=unclassified Rhizobium TaxID=2613769 RepID=UPI000689C4DA|nr:MULTISPECIES: HIT domain-containing protein [unclassified Rhizobium]RKD61405.1 HIT domain-containing protein [Rhizobium sp. WW_1]